MKRTLKHGSILVIALLIVFGVMFHINTKQVYAGEGMGDIIKGYNKDKTFYVGDRAYVTMDSLKSEMGNDFESLYQSGKVAVKWGFGDTYLTSFYDSSSKEFYYTILPSFYGKEVKFITESLDGDTYYNRNAGKYYPVSTYINISINKSGIATVTGEITNSTNTFNGVLIDGANIVSFNSYNIGKTTMNFTFDAKKYSIGSHSYGVKLSDGTQCNNPIPFKVSIYEVPKITASWFQTDSTSFDMTAKGFSSASYGDVYVDYKKGANGTWSTQWGPFHVNAPSTVNRLSPNSIYYVRAYYVKKVGSSYYIGPVSGEVAIKTGPAKAPDIKSIKISKAKVKKVWVKPIRNVFGFIIKKGFWTKETTYKVKITFKKRPGAAGIEVYAGGVTLPKFLKGNKKTYTTKFTVGGKAIGKKTAFTIRTKGNATYGAWSPPVTKKKIKIKK